VSRVGPGAMRCRSRIGICSRTRSWFPCIALDPVWHAPDVRLEHCRRLGERHGDTIMAEETEIIIWHNRAERLSHVPGQALEGGRFEVLINRVRIRLILSIRQLIPGTIHTGLPRGMTQSMTLLWHLSSLPKLSFSIELRWSSPGVPRRRSTMAPDCATDARQQRAARAAPAFASLRMALWIEDRRRVSM